MAQSIIYIDNDNLLELNGLKDVSADTYVNDAAVSVILVDSTGTEVVGQSWPLSLAYVVASNGNYRAVLDDGLSLSIGGKYTATISVDAGSGLIGKWTLKAVAKVRGVS